MNPRSGRFARMPVPLAAEIAAARAVGALSRLVGAGGGTTVPGKLLSILDPGAVDRLAARLPAGTVAISATNGKTTTAAMAAEILRPRFRLAHNRSGANLLSGVASTLLAARDAELGLLEVDEAALPEIIRRVHPRVVLLGTSSATSSTATASSSSSPPAGAMRWRRYPPGRCSS